MGVRRFLMVGRKKALPFLKIMLLREGVPLSRKNLKEEKHLNEG